MSGPGITLSKEDYFALVGERDLLREALRSMVDADLNAEVERLRKALTQIAGHFIDGERNTYAPAAETLDMIRVEATEALALASKEKP